MRKAGRRITLFLFLFTFLFAMFTCTMGISLIDNGNLSTNSLKFNHEGINVSGLKYPVSEEDIVAHIQRNSSEQDRLLWKSIRYRMVIISPDDPEFISLLNDYAEYKKLRGVPALVLSNWSKYNGRDGPEKIRNAIKQCYEIYNITYVLLAGSTSKIPIRKVYNPDTEIVGICEANGKDNELKPTDYYYAALEGDWNIDNDGHWGESPLYNDLTDEDEIINWNPQVIVGRLPANTPAELASMLNKSIYYQDGSDAGVWMNRILLASGISDHPSNIPGHIDLDGEDEAILSDFIIKNYIGKQMIHSHILEATRFYPNQPFYPNGGFCNLSESSFTSHINTGGSIFLWAGHGAPDQFTPKTTSCLTRTSINSLENSGKYGLLFADACSTNMYDDQDRSMGEAWIKKENAGGIGYIGGMRITWYFTNDTNLIMLNRGVTRYFFEQFFIHQNTRQGDALYASKTQYINGEFHSYSNVNFTQEWERKIILTYMLLGDPEIDIFTNSTRSITKFFNDTLYEGSSLRYVVKDEYGNPVVDPVVTIWDDDGRYAVFRGGKTGIINIKLPLGQRTLNYSVYGHNVVFKNGSFSTILDNEKPTIGQYQKTPDEPKIDDTVKISIDSKDSKSGIANVYLILTNTESNYSSFNYFPMELVMLDKDDYSYSLSYLKPNDYLFSFVAFDNADNYIFGFFGSESGAFAIGLPEEFYALLGLNLVGIGFIMSVGYISVVGFKDVESKYSKFDEMMQRDSEFNQLEQEREVSN